MSRRIDVPAESLIRIEEQFELKQTKIRRTVTAGRLKASSHLVLTDGRVRSEDHDRLKRAWDRHELKGEQPSHAKPSEKISILDLFSGCGGLALGATRAIRAVGLEPNIILAADMDREALEVYQSNLAPSAVLCENLWPLVDFQLLRDGAGVADFLRTPLLLHNSLKSAVGLVDLVIGGPPCEGHSNFNNSTRRNDPRNLLYLVPLAIGVAVGAKAIIIENVPEVTRDQFAQVTLLARQIAESRGYQVDDRIVNSLAIGVPQTRRRHLLVATKRLPPQLTMAVEALKTDPRDVKFAIGDLVAREGVSLFDTPSELSPENRKRIDHLFRYGLYDMPNKIRPECHQNGTSYISVYGRLDWLQPSGTITTGFLSPGRGRYIHPERRRTLTPHEAARIQGFPDDFLFELPEMTFSKKALSKLIGDAVPPQLGYLAALTAIATF